MPLERVWNPFSFGADIPDNSSLAGGFTRTQTSLALDHYSGNIFLGYSGHGVGVVESFHARSGLESYDNIILSDTYETPNGTAHQFVEDVNIVTWWSGGFHATWTERGVSPFTATPSEIHLYGQYFYYGSEARNPQSDRLLDEDSDPTSVDTLPSPYGYDTVNTVFHNGGDEYIISIDNGYREHLITSSTPPELLFGIDRYVLVRTTENALGADHLEISIYNEHFEMFIADPFYLSVERSGHTLSGSTLAALAILDGNEFAVLVHSTYDNDSEFFDIALYDSEGTPLSSSPRQIDFGVPTSALGTIEVLGLPNGGYAVIYERTDDGGPNQNLADLDVYVQIYDVNENQIGDPLRVNAVQTGDQGGFDAIITEDRELLVSYYDLETEQILVQRIALPATSEQTPTALNDFLLGTSSADIIDLLNGDDDYYAYGGDDLIDGNDGSDYIDGGAGRDTLLGGDGNDILDGGSEFDLLRGGAGNDDLYAGRGRDTVYGGDGDDYITDHYQPYALDLARGLFFSDAGNDTVYGEDGTDTIHGGDGRDVLHGGDHPDLIFGDAGRDTIYGDFGRDVLHGGDDHDEIHGGYGGDTIRGGEGNDELFGGADFDRLEGGLGDDTIFGGAGNDTVFGGRGNDDLVDNSQRDERGNDLFDGGAGNDTLRIGGGNDTVTGGAGADTFEFFGSRIGADVVTDYTHSERLRLDDALWTGTLTRQEVIDQFSSYADGALTFDFGNGNSIVLVTQPDFHLDLANYLDIF